METLSDYEIPMENGGKKNVEIEEMYCGENHCLSKLNIGVLMIWGGNEYG